MHAITKRRTLLVNKPVGMDYIALGNQLKLKKFTIEYDYKLSMEDLDRTTIVSRNSSRQSLSICVERNGLYRSLVTFILPGKSKN